MKLESLNNKKFKLNTKEMGSLVGGQITCHTTPSGPAYNKDGTYNPYSADARTEYTGSDIQNNVTARTNFYRGECDVVAAQNDCILQK